MRAAGRRLYVALNRAYRRNNAVGKTMRGAALLLPYSLMGGGAFVAIRGLFDPAMDSLVGVSFLATGMLALTMMKRTGKISKKLYEALDKLDKKTDEVLMAIMGPPELDKNGEPVKRDYSKNNLLKAIEAGNDKIDKMAVSMDKMAVSMDKMANRIDKMGDKIDKMGDKIDMLVDNMGRLSSDVRDLARGKQGREAGARPPELSARAEGGPSRVGGAETSRF